MQTQSDSGGSRDPARGPLLSTRRWPDALRPNRLLLPRQGTVTPSVPAGQVIGAEARDPAVVFGHVSAATATATTLPPCLEVQDVLEDVISRR